jgi:hypothetical protein
MAKIIQAGWNKKNPGWKNDSHIDSLYISWRGGVA